MEMPDVIGLEVEDALTELRDKGYTVESIAITKPVKAVEPVGIARVVRLSQVEGTGLRVVVAYQDYVKGGVQ
ncbi:MAG TPA: PASTA domain-containing protein [Desulfobacteria bacterium]|nr:PASTA domain-containing protein [Desulfobacteria bacterium]